MNPRISEFDEQLRKCTSGNFWKSSVVGATLFCYLIESSSLYAWMTEGWRWEGKDRNCVCKMASRLKAQLWSEEPVSCLLAAGRASVWPSTVAQRPGWATILLISNRSAGVLVPTWKVKLGLTSKTLITTAFHLPDLPPTHTSACPWPISVFFLALWWGYLKWQKLCGALDMWYNIFPFFNPTIIKKLFIRMDKSHCF